MTNTMNIQEEDLEEFVAHLRYLLDDAEVSLRLSSRITKWCDEVSNRIDPERFYPGDRVTLWHGGAESPGVVRTHKDQWGKYYVVSQAEEEENQWGMWVHPHGSTARMARIKEDT